MRRTHINAVLRMTKEYLDGKMDRLPLIQVVERFRPAIASEYRFAQANMAYSRFSFFCKPRYAVFL